MAGRGRLHEHLVCSRSQRQRKFRGARGIEHDAEVLHEDVHRRERGGLRRLRREDAPPSESSEVLLPFEAMAEAKLVLTDALIAESLKRGKTAERAARQQAKTRAGVSLG